MTTNAVTLTPNTYTLCPTALIVASLTNRKHFAPEPLQALSDNIKARGIDQPIIVRALPGARLAETFDAPKGQPKPAYEIVSGERRFRAADMAGLTQVPVILRLYNDTEAIEAQLVENIQRESLSELDEAEGFDVWLQQPGITIDLVADKISKSRRYVFSRLQLLKLQPETKQALRFNLIDVSRALLLAPVHDPKLQIKALEFAATVPAGGTQPSVRELQVWLQQNIMLALDRAPFPITVKTLVPKAGACKPDCHKRTGAQPDVFEYVVNADTCTDLICWKAKEVAHTADLQVKADALGMRLVHGAEAKTICYPNSSTLKGYSPLSQVRDDGGGQRLDKLLGPCPDGAVLIEDPYSRHLIRAVPTVATEAALLAKGLIDAFPEPKAPKADEKNAKASFEEDIARLQVQQQQCTKAEYMKAIDKAMLAAIANMPDAQAHKLLSPSVLRAFVESEAAYQHSQAYIKALGLDADKVHKYTNGQVCKVAALLLVTGEPQVELAVADVCGIDLEALSKKVSAQVRAEFEVQIAALKKPPKTPSPKSPLAQPSTAPVADAENPKPKTATPKAKAKLSAKDAQLGIAEAMQGIEAPPADGAVPVLKAAPAYTKGQQVKVSTIREDHEYWRVKYEGKTGKVDAVHKNADDEDLYVITFKGRSGGVAEFTGDELEAVAA